MCCRLLYKKYMINKDFFSTKCQGVLNFEKGCIGSNIYLSGGLCTEWVMEIKQSFG
jgi:hypothetical protein